LKRLLVTSLLALLAWSYPIHAASAKAEPIVPIINYAKLHEPRRAQTTLQNTRLPNGSSASYSGRHYSGKTYTKEEVENLIRKYSADYKTDPALPIRIAKCESGLRWDAANPISSARGVFQYLKGTFANTPEGKAGLSVFDADANVRAAVRHIAVHGTAPWNASRSCWNK
jgi:hypothetical protein